MVEFAIILNFLVIWRIILNSSSGIDYCDSLKKIFQEQIDTHQRLLKESAGIIAEVVVAINDCLTSRHKLLLCGNGGSAADAQHVAAEIVGRFACERSALPAIALTTDTSIITALGNDYGFDQVFARQVEALAQKGDVVVGISTSGNSLNVIAALETAREIGAKTIGFTGSKAGAIGKSCDICFYAPAENTARIQELHIAAWHGICEIVEAAVAGKISS